MIVLFFFLNLDFEYKGKTEKFVLNAGKYRVHCIGAQGGFSYENGKNDNGIISHGDSGGYGAHVIGEMTLYGERTFYANVGGVGSSGIVGPNKGGWNGGGYSGKDTGSNGNDGPGGGGGATDIRIDTNDIDDRIIVAAGGSGAAYSAPGADGGGIYGKYINVIHNDKDATEINQYQGYAKFQGGPGEDGKFVPGSGGGGGYYGGRGGYQRTVGLHHESVGLSGSSYISGHNGCPKHDKMTFTNTNMITGDINTGSGRIYIEELLVCTEKCYTCQRNQTCDICSTGYYLYENNCYSKCPRGTTEASDGKSCDKCSDDCETCSLSIDHCESCNQGKFLYNNKCYDDCDQFNDNTNDIYYGKDINNRLCKTCSDTNCISCSSDYSKCEKCPEKFEVDINTNQCVLKPTEIFTKSNPFTQTAAFTQSNYFSSSPVFSESATFSKSDEEHSSNGFITSEDEYSSSKEFSSSGEEHLTSEELSSSGFPIESAPDCYYFNEEGEFPVSGRCSYTSERDKMTQIIVHLTKFTDITYKDGDGGVIYAINCGYKSRNTVFIRCVSTSGGGGAIYLKNSLQHINSINMDGLYFEECKALFGGAVFVYARYSEVTVNFISCRFVNNSLLQRSGSVNNNNPYSGGIAILLASNSANFSKCSFVSNKKGSALKILNKFSDDELNAHQLNQNNHTILISECVFEQLESSGNSIYFVNENQDDKIDIIDCEFKGKLKRGVHYIDGKVEFSSRPKILINSCIFDDEFGSSIKIQMMNKTAPTDNKKNFEFNGIKATIVVFIMIGLLVITALVALIIRKIKSSDDDDELKERNEQFQSIELL